MSSDAGGYRSSLPGANRPSAHPRLHAIAKPYTRPSSFAGISTGNGIGLSGSATMTDLANVSSSLSPTKSPTKALTTRAGPRPSLSTSSSYGSLGTSLPRSGSDSSLFSGIKSMFSRPLQWLASPAKSGSASTTHYRGAAQAVGAETGGKRDSFSSFGHDLEDPEMDDDHSPSDRRKQGKRFRRASPSPGPEAGSQLQSHSQSRSNGLTPRRGVYEPTSGFAMEDGPKFEVTGRAVSGFMLPPLSPNVTLKPKSYLPGKNLASNLTNFSRPLGSTANASGSGSGLGGMSSSKSMSYLDPTPDVLGSSPRKGGMLTRSKRIELSSLTDDDETMGAAQRRGEGGSQMAGSGKEGETWSPWKSRYSTAGGAASSAAVGRPTTPGRKTPARLAEQRDYTLPSISPFKPPPSPLARQSPAHVNQTLNGGTSSLTRSATTSNIRRAASVASDISMGVGRAGSVKGVRHSGSMIFGSVNGDRERDDDKMSVDGEQKQREGSVLDWFMRDRWDGRGGSPASLAASRRLGSAGPSLSHPPIRKGQLVWNEDEKAFVRESELRSAQAPPLIHKSEAERILHTLENMRKTPLADARKGDLPPSVGQSSRTIRKTINVPLATAAAGDSAKQRRDKERLGGDERVSVMISPYGRRKVVDQAARDERKQNRNDRDARPSATPSVSEARSDTRSQSQVSDVEMEASQSNKGRSSAPPTPRRSSRLRRNGNGHDEEEASAPTPKARRAKRATSKQPETVQEESTPRTSRRTRKDTVERGTSPTHPPPVPTITATAPSPGGAQEASTSSSTYQPLADGERSRGGSSLRAKSDVSKRTHQGAANYSRSATPSSSGRFSAKEEDLPDMDDLEQAKIPLPSFSGISFAGLSAGFTSTATNGSSTSMTVSASGSSAQESSEAASNANQAGQSLNVPPPGRRPGGPLARLGHSSTRPRASSPLAGGSFVAEPESPPTLAPKSSKPAEPVQPPANGFFALNGSAPTPGPAVGSTTPLGKPPASSFFSGASSAAPSGIANGDSSSKPFSFGLGKPSSAPAPAAEKPSGIPDFFGKNSAPPSGTTTPTSVPAFDFGLPKKTAEEPKAVPVGLPAPSFSFGSTAEKANTPSTAAANGNGDLFGSKKADSVPASAGFSFGAPQSTDKAKESTPSFSFGTTAPKPTDPSKSLFSFGAPDKSAEPAKSTFSFGAPSSPAPASNGTSEPAKTTFSFGAPSAASAAEKPVEAAKPAFSFGAPASSSSASAPKPAEPAKPSFSFGATSNTTPASSPASGFGAPTANGSSATPAAAPGFGGSVFGKPAETKDTAAASNPFGAASPAATPSFTFGAPSSTTNSTSSPFGAPSATGTNDATKSNPFGATSAATSAAPASSSFTFGAPSSGQVNGGSTGFGASAPAASAQPASPFAFGSSSTASSPALAPTSNPFGNSAPAPSSPSVAPAFSFGAPGPAAATSAPPSNPFGASQQAQPATAGAGGFNFSFGGGAPAPAVTAPTASSASTGFNFGAPQTPSAAAPAPGAFTFGAGSSISTTPAAPPPGGAGGFTFGAPQAQAQAQAQRFGSPAPSPAPGADGGFSLGADAGPASPGGRRMKALPRRGAVKR